MQASQQAQGVGRKKTRKRKKIKVDYYGYDPSIVVMEGDPRLNPPPAWFGVNYHPSQPISNSWIEWSGADVAMFDISNNKAIPLPKDCSLAQDSLKRRKHKLDSAPSSGAVSAPDKKKKKQISNMTLHPFQPTRNEWTDWNSMDASSAGANGTSENGEHGRIPALIPVPPPLSRPKPNESTTEEDLMTSLQEAWDVTELKRSWAMSTADLDQPIEVRNKILAKLNRMRKAMYQFQIEQHRNHLLELMRVLTTRKESYTAHERALIGLALAGDSTDSHALSHEHCEHRHKDDELPTAKAGTPAATDGFDPIKARAKLKVELATKMHVRRMMVFLDQDSKTRAAIADRAFKQITLAVKELTNYATALVMLGSTSMSSGLADAVQLTPAQREQFLHGYEERLADCLRAMALYRVVSLLRSRLFLPEAASTNAKVTETLSGKQILKLLSKVASREVFVDSTDPMEDLLGQIRRLSLLTRSASSQNMESKS
ncbi:Hypothetical Protein FCC1311_080862 [Hondaea fermentalgiana]|uniref:Uncharacterized protein n=1 Tax=Hondaea fermentalgiana TaxID=2315210 RepID=A0A2R5GTZ3_9STRA|nr:Hypothetical Protein FCC1311_080862 [Hondaea fermentalgiana]|eukprot:GBG31861.1 Hypothetical Protein FCC1311_080862 [Hondaea fermentalgiana]